MNSIKLLDVSNPKKIKDTLNNLTKNYETFAEQVQDVADKSAEDSASAVAFSEEAKQIVQESAEALEQSIAAQDLKLNDAIAAQDAVVSLAAQDAAEAKQAVANKQDKLTAGENIFINENNVISSTGGSGGGLSIADLPKFVNKIYINMANRTALAGELTLNCVESSNFVVDWGDGSLTEYADATTTLSHTYTDTNFAGWIYIYGNWNGIAYDSDSSARAYVIEQVIYDNNITNIPNKAFRFANKLTSVKLPNSVLRIEDQAFYYSGLVDVELPSNLEYLGSSALGNTKIYRIVIPASAAVGESAVSLADNLTEIEIAEGRTNFNNMYYMLRGNHTVKFLKIPNSITSFYFVLRTGYSDVETVEFIRSTPPTISSTAGIFDTQKTIIVPYASLKQYKTKTNLTAFADKIYPKGGTYSETITIPSTAWDTTTNTATVEAVGATSEARNVITWFTSSGGSQVENTYGLKCTAQGTMQLTFSCETIPTEDVEVSVSYMLTNY